LIRVLIADDHPIVRAGLRHIVQESPDINVSAEVDDAASAIELCASTAIDVVLLDITMPGPGFVEVIRQLSERSPRVRILILSIHPEELFARRALQAGAHGYLTKNYSTDELISAIVRVHSGRQYITPSLAEELALDLTRDERKGPQGLTNREYEVFLELGVGHTVNQIAGKLGLSAKSVRTYRSRIVQKLQLATTSELLLYAVRRRLIEDMSSPADSKPSPGGAINGPVATGAAGVDGLRGGPKSVGRVRASAPVGAKATGTKSDTRARNSLRVSKSRGLSR
jgi:DNA-binding NarL/FixJ family response regulator